MLVMRGSAGESEFEEEEEEGEEGQGDGVQLPTVEVPEMMSEEVRARVRAIPRVL